MPAKLEGKEKVVGLGRVELPTSPLSGARSNQLSYRPMHTFYRSVEGTEGNRSGYTQFE